MQPFSNYFPLQVPNQTQPSGSTGPLNPQVFSTDPISSQPQLGILNPQNSIPFVNNPGTHLSNQQAMFLYSQLVAQQQPGLSVVNQLGIPQMGLSNVGIVPQNLASSLGTVPLMINPANPFHGQGQFLVPNITNLAQGQLNLNVGLANLHNQLQNMNGVLPIQFLNLSQASLFNVPSGVNQVVGSLGSNRFGDSSLVIGPQINQNQQSSGFARMSSNMFSPNKHEQVNSISCGLQQTQNSQPSALFGQLGNPGKIAQSGSNQNNFSGNNFTRDWKKKGSQFGNQRSQFQPGNNRKRKFGSQFEHKGKGARHGYEKVANSSHDNHMKQAGKNKRSIHLMYTEQEIKQWREERRKNFPSKENIEKKKAEKLKQSDVFERQAKLRREQLREILVKQAELGVEVAEIPSHYLSDKEKPEYTEKLLNGTEQNTLKPNKRWRCGRRGKKRNGRFAHRHSEGEKGLLSVSSVTEREPTLLEKLLSADIRRDKRRLLQAFRFMVSNSFFKDWPEKPLKYPLVATKEEDCEDAAKEEVKSSLAETLGSAGKFWEDGCSIGDATDDDNESGNNVRDDDDYDREPIAAVERKTYFDEGIGNPADATGRIEEAEEGEIID